MAAAGHHRPGDRRRAGRPGLHRAAPLQAPLALIDEATTALGTTLDVVRTAEEFVALLVPDFADFAAVDLLDWVLDAEAPRCATTPTW